MFTQTGTLELVITTISDFVLGWAAEGVRHKQPADAGNNQRLPKITKSHS